MFSKRLLRLPSIYRASFLRATTPASAQVITMTSQDRAASSAPRTPLVPREFPSSGFEIIGASVKVEEETLPFYNPRLFYPVRIGEAFGDRYQVVAKLGYGTTSTTWLCHDLVDHRYVTLKVHVNALTSNRELEVYQHLKGVESDHPGREMIRMLKDSFKLQGPHGTHEIFVLPPLGLSLGAFQDMMPRHVFAQTIVAITLQRVLAALDFLHGPANLTHTDIHAGNLLIGIDDESQLAEFEEAELVRPSSRKMVDGITIHVSQFMLKSFGPLYLCDFGDARVGSEHEGIAMPIQYRAPEIILDMPWSHSVDMWSVGLLAWDLLEPESLFRLYDANDPARNEAHHLANMIALLGPPPLEFLERSSKSREYWDENGNWRGIVPIPTERNLDSLATSLEEGKDRDEFLDLVRGLLRWLPEERLNSYEAFSHPWVSGS
ncbi:kinase-like protein [Durotheca rogersii]|uniref:kinase-like protein n=1 Tax=Durotheca rogersii TaxID=419775 RepID=UPI00221E4DE3|nr:kinase-like protein [Durotheca rogersii]KAI5863435.1 kinase-like protein [Durotheca rogersii]